MFEKKRFNTTWIERADPWMFTIWCDRVSCSFLQGISSSRCRTSLIFILKRTWPGLAANGLGYILDNLNRMLVAKGPKEILWYSRIWLIWPVQGPKGARLFPVKVPIPIELVHPLAASPWHLHKRSFNRHPKMGQKREDDAWFKHVQTQWMSCLICTAGWLFAMDAVARRNQLQFQSESLGPDLCHGLESELVARCLRNSHHMLSCHLSATVVFVCGGFIFLWSVWLVVYLTSDHAKATLFGQNPTCVKVPLFARTHRSNTLASKSKGWRWIKDIQALNIIECL